MLRDLFEEIDRARGDGLLAVVAHPDDETIGFGTRLSRWPLARIVTVTDGSPLRLDDARRAGCRTRVGYAALRRKELEGALEIAGFPRQQCECLDLVDQRSPYHLTWLARQIADRVDRLRVRWVLTHPYEGGHPDHDAAAFACQAAIQLIADCKPLRIEFACYHLRSGRFVAGQFRPCDSESFTPTFTEKDHGQRRWMMQAHRSQSSTLAQFEHCVEQFRLAPEYDFSHAPQEPWYASMPFGMDVRTWEQLAAEAWHELSGLCVVSP
jgi:N-acetylglucosamine malate deacetylase 2